MVGWCSMGTFNDPCVKQSQLTDGWERSSGIAHQHTAPVGPWGHHFAFARRLRHSGLELLQRFVTDVAKEVGAFGPATLLQFGLQIFQRSFLQALSLLKTFEANLAKPQRIRFAPFTIDCTRNQERVNAKNVQQPRIKFGSVLIHVEHDAVVLHVDRLHGKTWKLGNGTTEFASCSICPNHHIKVMNHTLSGLWGGLHSAFHHVQDLSCGVEVHFHSRRSQALEDTKQGFANVSPWPSPAFAIKPIVFTSA